MQLLTFRRLMILAGLAPLLLTGCKEATLGPETFGSIQGQVVDFATGHALPGASVTTAPPTGALITDGEGRFTIDEVPAGNYAITATRSGYRPNTVTISVRDNRVTPAVLYLREEEEAEIGTRLNVQILNWANRARGDSNFVRIEYRAQNIGTDLISAYEVYFRVHTDGDTYYEERGGTNLAPGQSDIANFEKFIVRDQATAVVVDTFWVAGP